VRAGGPWACRVRYYAPPPEVAAELPGARLQGRARLRFLGLRVYDARLWAPAAGRQRDWAAAAPLALEIEYARSLDGGQIAERSLVEMRARVTSRRAPAALAG
jgi:hypothetical protein